MFCHPGTNLRREASNGPILVRVSYLSARADKLLFHPLWPESLILSAESAFTGKPTYTCCLLPLHGLTDQKNNV